ASCKGCKHTATVRPLVELNTLASPLGRPGGVTAQPSRPERNAGDYKAMPRWPWDGSQGNSNLELVQRMKTAKLAFRPTLLLGVMAALGLATATLVPQVAPAGPVSALAAAAMALSPDAPQEYVVKRGDTLWDISRMFLRQPWYWPEI